ncbi:hypothetical protein CFAM422_000963 [Trichoderma lentiforme]|uniref:Uncharacterized protein n=1 Tax=Trichoderma lentiforme TaxID=1567552 RepID=A0A9P4XNW3_9HYPO|nr:hypothetical protein CFAM422_000963 [Trichoderma lentiforme]
MALPACTQPSGTSEYAEAMAPPRLQAKKQSKEMHPAVALSSGWQTSDFAGEASRQIIAQLLMYIYQACFRKGKHFQIISDLYIQIFIALEDQCWLVYPEGYKDQPLQYTVKDYAQILIVQRQSPNFRP